MKARSRALWNTLALVGPYRNVLIAGTIITVVGRALSFVLPASTRVLLDDVIIAGHVSRLYPLLVVVVASAIVQGAMSLALVKLLTFPAERFSVALRVRLQHHILRLPISFFDSRQVGVIVSRIMSDAQSVRGLIDGGLTDYVGNLFGAVFALILMYQISPTMTGLAASVLALLGTALALRFRRLRPAYLERAELNARVTGRLVESLGGVRLVKAYCAERREENTFSSGLNQLMDTSLRITTVTAVMDFAVTALVSILGALLMFTGAREIQAGRMTIGAFFKFTMLVPFMAAPVVALVARASQLLQALVGAERIMEALREVPEDADPRRKIRLPAIEGNVVFDRVSFSYNGNGSPALRSVSLEARPGTVTALVGPSGAGKSTIIGLIAAFYVPSGGSIYVDGRDLSCVCLDSYRTQLAMVPQETLLFDATIRDNVMFSRPDASDERVSQACRVAAVDLVANGLPAGYETVVGERGVRLSGGERQRIAIARAVLADPRILVLDEATSSLDSESEALIQRGLAHILEGRTTFVIAHRLSTIRRADQILVLEKGQIVERGTHDGLLCAGGRYAKMLRQQAGGMVSFSPEQ